MLFGNDIQKADIAVSLQREIKYINMVLLVFEIVTNINHLCKLKCL